MHKICIDDPPSIELNPFTSKPHGITVRQGIVIPFNKW